MKIKNIFLIFISLVSGFLTSSLCPVKNSSGSVVAFRPPAWVFGIAWSILFLMIGFAWVNNKDDFWYFILLNIVLNMWIVIYSCLNDKKAGVWIIGISLLVSLLTYNQIKNKKYLMLPLVVWLIFALLMNATEVQYISMTKS